VRAVVAPPELSLTDWAVLGIVAEGPTHGFAIARELSASGTVGQVWTVARPLVYRSLTTLTERGLVEEQGATQSGRGPTRTMVRVTRRGRAALVRWLDTPVEHVREVRTALLLKLALNERSGRTSSELVARQQALLAPVFDSLGRRPRGEGFDLVLAQWRRESARAVQRFLSSLAR
jgi:DNA-binding PadR family transcriptional regulator